MKKKSILAVLALTAIAGGVALQATRPNQAMAATRYTFYNTNISLDGKTSSSPKHIVQDGTSFIPVYYLQNELRSIGIDNTWDNTGTLRLTVPTGLAVDLTNLPAYQGPSSNTIRIYMNGTPVEYGPKIATTPPEGGEATTYVPIWYLEQALNRIGIKSSWDGTNWAMLRTQKLPNATKLQAVKDFVTAMHITPDLSGSNPYDDVSSDDWKYVNAVVSKGYFPANSVSHFGSSDSIDATTIDHAYQLSVGIPDSHMIWNAGGNLAAWSQAIGLNHGIVQPSALSTGDEQQIANNLKGLYQGFTVDGDGTYHVVFQPYDGFTEWDNNPRITQSFATQSLVTAIENVDSITFTISGSTINFKAPGIASTNKQAISIGSIFNSTGNHTQYSLNNGSSWQTATGVLGYDSWDTSNGGTSNPSSTVLVKTTGHVDIGAGILTPSGDTVGLLAIGITPNSTGTPTVTCGITAQ